MFSHSLRDGEGNGLSVTRNRVANDLPRCPSPRDMDPGSVRRKARWNGQTGENRGQKVPCWLESGSPPEYDSQLRSDNLEMSALGSCVLN